MKKISRIIGLAAVLAAVMFTACAPVTDSSEWKAPIAPTTVKDTELNKTPLTAQGLERLLQGWWISGSEGYYFTVDNGVKKGYKWGGTLAPAASVRATLAEGFLFDHEEFTWEVLTGGRVRLTLKKPTGSADSIAAKVETTGYNYDYFFKDKAVHADGTIVDVDLDFRTWELHETYSGTKRAYVFDYGRSDEMDVIVGYGDASTGSALIDRNGSGAKNFEKYVATFRYTTVARSGTAPTYTYAMGTAEYELKIIDLVEDIAKLNKILARGYNIEEFEIPVAFDPSPKIKLMTVSIYNSKEGKVKEYKNVAYTKVTDTTASKIVFTVNGIDYEITMPTTTDARAGGKLTKWYKGSAAAGATIALPLPTATTPATYTAADYDVNGTAVTGTAVSSGDDDGKGKIALKTITADDKQQAMFIFKIEDKFVGRIPMHATLSAGTAIVGRPGSSGDLNTAVAGGVQAIRQRFTKPGTTPAQLVIGDRTTTAYEPEYSIYKPYHDFEWHVYSTRSATGTNGIQVVSDTASVDVDYANAEADDRSMVFNGKFTPHKATFQFFQASDDIIKDAYHMGNTLNANTSGWLLDGSTNVNYDGTASASASTQQAATAAATNGAANNDAFNEAALNYGLTLNGLAGGSLATYDAKADYALANTQKTAGTAPAEVEVYRLPANGSYQSFEVELKDLANGMKMSEIIAKYGQGLKTPGDITINNIVYKFKGWSDWFNPADTIYFNGAATDGHVLSNADRFQGWQNAGTGGVNLGADENLPSNIEDTATTPTYVNHRKPMSSEKYTAFHSDGTAGNNPKAPYQLGYGYGHFTTPVPATLSQDNLTVRLFAQYERKGVYAYFYKANRPLEASATGAAPTATTAATGEYAVYDFANPAAKVLVTTDMIAPRNWPGSTISLEKNKKVAELYNGTAVADIANGSTPHTFIGAWSTTPSIAPTTGRGATNPGPGAPAADLTYADVTIRKLADDVATPHRYYASYMTGAPIVLKAYAASGVNDDIRVPNIANAATGSTTVYVHSNGAVTESTGNGVLRHAQLTTGPNGTLARYLKVQDGNAGPNDFTTWFDIKTDGTFNGNPASAGNATGLTAIIYLNAAGGKVFTLTGSDNKPATDLRFTNVEVYLR